MVECACLENTYVRKGIAGSNPVPSAIRLVPRCTSEQIAGYWKTTWPTPAPEDPHVLGDVGRLIQRPGRDAAHPPGRQLGVNSRPRQNLQLTKERDQPMAGPVSGG